MLTTRYIEVVCHRGHITILAQSRFSNPYLDRATCPRVVNLDGRTCMAPVFSAGLLDEGDITS